VRIGLLADTHDEVVPFAGVLDAVGAALGDVGLILHCGDLTTTGVLDQLAALAPVVAVRSAGDPPPAPPRLLDGPHVLEVDGVVIGLVNHLGGLEPEALFGRHVDVVVHGGTHEASVERRAGVLCVNPGSPTLADVRTVAWLETDPVPAAQVIELA
jgi:putative phosphoesterase